MERKCTTCSKTRCPFRSSGIKISDFSLFIVGCKISYRGEQIFDLSWLLEGKPFMRLRKSQVKKALISLKKNKIAS